MESLTTDPLAMETLADLVDRLGNIPLHRIPAHPAPGTATEEDVFHRPVGAKRPFELVDGVLVEKPMGYYESILAGLLLHFLWSFLQQHSLGFAMGEAATMRLMPGLLRIPDVSFVSWDHFPDRKLPAGRVLNRAPDLAVEVISEGNTAEEMERKLREYFTAGVRLVWYAYPETRTVQIYTSPTDLRTLGEDGILDGGTVLPGFQLSIREWFEAAGERQA